jgi:hypothetical protein
VNRVLKSGLLYATTTTHKFMDKKESAKPINAGLVKRCATGTRDPYDSHSFRLAGTCNVLVPGSAIASTCVEKSPAVFSDDGHFCHAVRSGDSISEALRHCRPAILAATQIESERLSRAYGESNVRKGRWFSKTVSETYDYARKDEFVGVFECEQVSLQRLALLLTANSELAKLCLIRALGECIASGSVFKGWEPNWACRAVIRNAIGLVMSPGGQSYVNTNDDTDDGLVAFPADDSVGAIAAYESIVELSAFDRFVFVICALERYSTHDCAVLLGKSVREVNEARHRIDNQAGQISEFSNTL